MPTVAVSLSVMVNGVGKDDESRRALPPTTMTSSPSTMASSTGVMLTAAVVEPVAVDAGIVKLSAVVAV